MALICSSSKGEKACSNSFILSADLQAPHFNSSAGGSESGCSHLGSPPIKLSSTNMSSVSLTGASTNAKNTSPGLLEYEWSSVSDGGSSSILDMR